MKRSQGTFSQKRMVCGGEGENGTRMRIDEAQRREESFHQQVCQMKLGDKSPTGRSLGFSAGAGCFSPSVICLIAQLREINGCS